MKFADFIFWFLIFYIRGELLEIRMAALEPPASQATKLVDRATSKLLEEVDWPINLELASLCSTNAELSEAVVAVIRKRLSKATRAFASTSANAERSYLFCLTLLNCLMKHAWLTLPFVHNSDLLNTLQKLATSRKTRLLLRDKIIRLARVWAAAFHDSVQFPKFWLTNQTIVNAVGQQIYDSVTNGLDDTPPELVETFCEPAAPEQTPTGSFIVTSAALHPPQCLRVALPEIVATRTFRISAKLPQITTKLKLCQDFLDIMDAPDIETNDTLGELYPECQRYHNDIVEWIADGQVSEALMTQLLTLNEQILEINQAYNTLASGGSVYHEYGGVEESDVFAPAVTATSMPMVPVDLGGLRPDEDDIEGRSQETPQPFLYQGSAFQHRDEDDSQSISELSVETEALLKRAR